MLNRFARALVTRLLTPAARALLAVGISPDVVTLVGTLGVMFGALAFYPRGSFFWGTVVISLFAFSDSIDGIMARLSGTTSTWGAFLDSTLDRFGDAAIFGGLVLYYAGRGDSRPLAALAIYCLVMGSITSYARARAESLGMEAKGGIAERAEALAALLAMTGLSGAFDAPSLIPLTLGVLAVASTITVAQRIMVVRSQAKAAV